MKLTGVTLLAQKSKSPFAEHQKELGECGLRAAWGCLAIWWGHRNQRGWDSHPQGIILFINRHTHTYTCIWCLWRMLWTISTELQSQVEQSSELYRINMLGDCVLRHSVWLCPMDSSPPGSSVYGDSPGKNTGVGWHAVLQGIFPTQSSNPGLPQCRWILYNLRCQGSPGDQLLMLKCLGEYICHLEEKLLYVCEWSLQWPSQMWALSMEVNFTFKTY